MYDILPNEYVIGTSCFMNITKSETCYYTWQVLKDILEQVLHDLWYIQSIEHRNW
jgi:hypothetical protein